MKYVSRRFAAAFAAAFLIVSANGCAAFRSANILTVQQEIALGERFDEQILAAETELPNHPAARYLNDLTQRLAARCVRPDIAYHVKLLASEDVNAYAQLGGYLYVNIGLLRAVESGSGARGRPRA